MIFGRKDPTCSMCYAPVIDGAVIGSRIYCESCGYRFAERFKEVPYSKPILRNRPGRPPAVNQ